MTSSVPRKPPRTPPRSPYNRKRLEAHELEAIDEYDEYTGAEFPKTRAECVNGIRPCPFVRCRHHLYLDVRKTRDGKSDTLRINFPHLDPTEMAETCSLDLADANPDGLTLEEMGQVLNITRERARQLEHAALRKLRLASYKLRNKELRGLVDIWESFERQEPVDLGLYILG